MKFCERCSDINEKSFMEEANMKSVFEAFEGLKTKLEVLHLNQVEMVDLDDGIQLNIICKYADVASKTWAYVLKPCTIQHGRTSFSTQTELDENFIRCLSNDGRLLAKVKTSIDDTQIFSVTNEDGFVFSVDLTLQKDFGKIYKPNEEAGCFLWSNDNNFLIFIAKKYREDFKKVSLSDCKKLIEIDPFRLRDNLGEQLEEIDSNILVCFDMKNKTFEVLNKFKDNVWPGQFAWSTDNKHIYFIGTINPEGFTLGARFCVNRSSKLYEYSFETKQIKELRLDNISVRCPRPSPNGKFIAYLTCDAYGAHYQCFSLVLYTISDSTFETAVERVDRAHFSTTNYRFSGIYSFLRNRCWSGDSRFIFFDGEAGFYTRVYAYDTDLNCIHFIECPKRDGSWHLLCVLNDKCLVYVTDFNTPFAIYLGIMKVEGRELKFEWIKVYEPTKKFSYSWEIAATMTAGLVSEALLLEGYKCASDRVIVTAHGGPNSRYCVEYNGYEILLSLCQLGFKILFLNYIGSLCYGSESLDELTGKVGEADIADCLRLINISAESFDLDKDKLYYLGGSHGGFIGATFIGKYPSMFKAAALRNPVCDTIGLLQSTDIPDFVFSQYTGKKFDSKYDVTEELLCGLLKVSPLHFINMVKTPTLFLLGSKDKRVPAHIGINFYRMLKARNVECAAYLYPDNHSLSELTSCVDCFIKIYIWFNKFPPR